MPGTPGDFRLYHSNALDLLAALLAEELRAPAPGQPLLAPDTILVPQVAMRRWLQATLAAKHGIAANLEFLTPGEFVARALDANVPALPQAPGKADGELDADALHWRVHAALSDPALLARPALAQIAAWLADGDAARAWSLAGELAAVFGKYSAWRRDWLLRWDDGADPDDPQAIIWRAANAGREHRARRIQRYLALRVDGEALPVGLPSRLFVFATLNVSPDVLRVIASQSRAGTLHFYLPTPTRDAWGDLRGTPFAERDDEHPLLRDWGAAGKDFLAMLGGYDVVHPSGDVDAHVDPLAGGLRGSLLRRMQSDLLHARAQPSGERRERIDRDDPGLQFHACHTRLRELQVLHDRLRALLEDERFDPPLQPRDIAVLAPDIDAYAPYLDAVFGGDGATQPIPYALADASPLAGEPLAEVFLRLLALPVSRFGLNDILDLLASPPLADAAQLDAADFERVHAWLRAAGARWGLDAAHRERLGAPRDDAGTWQFALDRLLLGHASGDDDFIAAASGEGIAPWSELEGGALDVLDRLLRLLRELARRERQFAEAATPAQWRESLLRMLDALLPRPPTAASAQRALERLRKLIDAFARSAAAADVDMPVPVDVVRAHFAAVLGEADTRAPLLTGGVSFARMVPMRLLPFRAICLLGMNDGEFPRRDPAAGLNRLTAELGTGQRRRGDRSTRDDDRFLFLQLFAAAQDVFYLSWLGADPRDGSAREPSALVSELLAAAGAYHAHPQEAARELVLRHPLQPFSPGVHGERDAGGSIDPRVFSYRGHWHPAAGSLAGARTTLAPWIAGDAPLPATGDSARELPLDALRRFLLDPAGQFLRQRLDIRLPQVEAVDADIEPMQAPSRGLERSLLQRAVFAARLDGVDEAAMQASLRARGMLPSGASGRHALRGVLDEIAPYADAFARWRGAAQPESLPLDVDIDGLRLHGRIHEVYANRIARLRFGAPNGPSAIRHGLDWLFARAAGVDMEFVEFHEDRERGIGPHRRDAISQAQALDALRALLALREEGLRRPLPFAPYSAWELFERRDNPARAVDAASKKWRGSERGWAEGDGDALRLALRGRDPFADARSMREFARLSGLVFGTLTQGIVVALDIGDIAMPDEDPEDAA